MTEARTTDAPVRVLVVDDHAMFRSGVRSELASAGAGVVDVVAEGAAVVPERREFREVVVVETRGQVLPGSVGHQSVNPTRPSSVIAM